MKKVVVVTGGSSGMGAEISKLLLKKGYTVVIFSRNADKSGFSKKDNCFTLNIDIQKISDIISAFKYTKKIIKDGTIDVLINSAGIGHETPLEDISEEEYNQFFSTNIKGLIFTCKTFLPIINRGTGIICNFSSIAGIKGFSKWSLYCASKYAVEGFSASLRHEVRTKGIRVMCVRPGSVNTPFYNYLSEEEKKDFINPQTVAEIVTQALEIDKNAVVEDIFINNAAGDL